MKELKSAVLDKFSTFVNSDVFLMSKGRILYELDKTLKEIGVGHLQKILMLQNEDSENDAEGPMLASKKEKIAQVKEVLPDVKDDIISFALTKNGDDVMQSIGALSEGLGFFIEELKDIHQNQHLSEPMQLSTSSRNNAEERLEAIRSIAGFDFLYELIFKLLKLNHPFLNDTLWATLAALPLNSNCKHHLNSILKGQEDMLPPGRQDPEWPFDLFEAVDSNRTNKSIYQLTVIAEIVRHNQNESILEWVLFQGNLSILCSAFKSPEMIQLKQILQQSKEGPSKDLSSKLRPFDYFLKIFIELNKAFLHYASMDVPIHTSEKILDHLVKAMSIAEPPRPEGLKEYAPIYLQSFEAESVFSDVSELLTALLGSPQANDEVYHSTVKSCVEFLTRSESGLKPSLLVLELVKQVGGSNTIFFSNLGLYYAAVLNCEAELLSKLLFEIMEDESQWVHQVPLIGFLEDLIAVIDKKDYVIGSEAIRSLLVKGCTKFKTVTERICERLESDTSGFDQAKGIVNKVLQMQKGCLGILARLKVNMREEMELIHLYEGFLCKVFFDLLHGKESPMFFIAMESDSLVRESLLSMIEVYLGSDVNLTADLLLKLKELYKSEDFSNSNLNYIDVRGRNSLIGIKNLGSTCYANSLLQQLFHNTAIRDFVLTLPVSLASQSTPLLVELKLLFSKLAYGNRNQADLTSFSKAFTGFDGFPIDVKVQQDVNEFFNLLLDIIERELREGGLGVEDQVRKELGGLFSNEISSTEPDRPYQTTNEEHFNTLSLDVKHVANLHEALDQFFKPEQFDADSKLFVEQYQTKISFKKQCWLDSKLPSTLVLMLKRFEYNMTNYTRYKLNDYFEFPLELNFQKWVRSQDEENLDMLRNNAGFLYRLKGVLVHSGNAEFGHYYSYVLIDGRWTELNDTKVSEFNPTDVVPVNEGEHEERMVRRRYHWRGQQL